MKIVKVTQRAINKGVTGDGFSCPIAIATGRRYFVDGKGLCSKSRHLSTYWPVWVPTKQDVQRYMDFINDFDNGKTVSPQSFRMKRAK